MNTIPAQDIKRRGMSALDQALIEGPVHVVKNNRPRYVVLSEEDFQHLMLDLAEVRLAASEQDLTAGRTRRGSAADLMTAILSGDETSG